MDQATLLGNYAGFGAGFSTVGLKLLRSLARFARLGRVNVLANVVRLRRAPYPAQSHRVELSSKHDRHVRVVLGMLLSLGAGACMEHKTDTLDAAAPSGKSKCGAPGTIGNCMCGAGRNGTNTCGADGEWAPCICVTLPDSGIHKLDAGS